MKKKRKALRPPRKSTKKPSSPKASTGILTAAATKWIRIDRPFKLPPYVRAAIQKLDDAGYLAYVVGGSVRDFLLERPVKDYDIATSATPNQVCELFENAITVGKAFGVIKVPVESGVVLEIATFREDLEYVDHRHPKGVVFAGPVEDSLRRDFTINSLFFDPKTSRIMDACGGMDDLKGQVVRAIGEPKQRFKEDALRLLRAVRFTTRLGFALDPRTADAVRACAPLIAKVSAERLRDELNAIWVGPRPDVGLALLHQLGLLSHLLPELVLLQGLPPAPGYQDGDGDLFQRTVRGLRLLSQLAPERSVTLGWAAVLRDVGKPLAAKQNAGKAYNGHEVLGAERARAIAARYHLTKTEQDQLGAILVDHLKFKDVFRMRESTLQRWIREPHFEELLTSHRVEALLTEGNLAPYEFCLGRLQEMRRAGSAPPKLLDGKDLILLGFRPGPEFSEILRTVEDLAYENSLLTKEQALEYVIKHFVH